MPNRHRFIRLVTTAAALAALGACSSMPGMTGGGGKVGATLNSASEVPPNASTGSGNLTGSYDKSSRMLRWTATYSGLTGAATMAHFHGPAMPGQNAGVVVGSPSASGAEGSATLTEAQAADLMAGKWYFNVHTAANPGGEIRGQVKVDM